jgi:hypothetical protein
MLVIVGPNWSQQFTRGTEPDWVLQEITKALALKIPIIPILLSKVDRIRAEEVPTELAKLARVQYLRFDYRNLDQDTEKIAQEVAESVSPPPPRRRWRFRKKDQ